ncbi:HsdM family class I SAM-dependent methyltransferase [Actinacidiphila alni]|uniref:HsdM family class I SAM-dependent methyltransferase n=1 Tax=Actinacidiphila alni TaxID=380248 RepID=UPI0015A5A360|nr:N-6 DNA methylase [Actinacidiphila alni]
MWTAIDGLADRLGAYKTAYQFALRMLLLRAVTDPLDTDNVWAWFCQEVRETLETEAPIAGVLEHALEREMAGSTAGTVIWEMRDHIQRPSAETQEALRNLVGVVDAVDGDLRDVFEMALEHYSRTNGEAGNYFTPRSVVSLAVRLADPRDGERVFDPACGSGGFLLAAHRHAATSAHTTLGLSGRESNRDAWQIGQMNLLAHRLRADLGEQPVDSLLEPASTGEGGNHVVLLNPPFNQRGWATDAEIKALPWELGHPPRSNANFAWLQRALALLAPNGRACVLMPDQSTRDSRTKAREITRRLVGTDAVEALVTLPSGLFPHVRVPACVWVLNKDKRSETGSGSRDRHDEILLVDASGMGEQVTRGQWVIPELAIERITRVLQSWRSHNWGRERGELEPSEASTNAWWTTVTTSDVEALEWDLTPSRYIPGSRPEGVSQPHDPDAEFDGLVRRLAERMARVHQLEQALLEKLGEW